MIKKIENLIPKTYADDIEQLLDGEDFQYFWNSTISATGESIDDRVKNNPGYTHNVFDFERQSQNSWTYPILKPILYFFEQKENMILDKVLRIRVRRTNPWPGHTLEHYNPPHIDLDTAEPYWSLVYYADDSDGDTFIFDNDGKVIERVKPVKGNALLFPGKVYHSGNNPVNYNKRTIVNFDFTVK